MRSPPKLDMLVVVVREAERWISEGTWAAVSMARSRVRGRRKYIVLFKRGGASTGDE